MTVYISSQSPGPSSDQVPQPVESVDRGGFWRYVEFWRPSIWALLLGLGAALALWLSLGRGVGREPWPVAEVLSFQAPHPKMTPRQVVQTQIEGLRNTQNPVYGALQCYGFASPSNRLAIGSFSRFYHLVRTPPYDRLGNCITFQIGLEQQTGPFARILATVVNQDRSVQIYTFVLERQLQPPFEGCWMTKGVFAMLPDPGLFPGPTPTNPTPANQET